MTRRLLLFALVVAALAAAVAGSLLTHAVSARPPVYALGSALVWHAEVAALLFVALYAAIVTVRLAYHGMTFTHMGSRGVEIPQLREGGRHSGQASAGIEQVVKTVEALETTAGRTEQRLRRLEAAHDVLLNPDQEDA
jgi:Na+/melibiose symporter-like transporter